MSDSTRLERLNQWLARYEGVIFLLLAVAHLAPLWTFNYFPSLDGAAHLDIVDKLVRYHDPESASVREFFEINIGLAPNYLIFALLYAFMQMVAPLTAEKLLLSLYVITLPLALRYALAGIAREAIPFALVGFLLIYNYPLHLGFYSYCFGLVAFLITMGFWLRRLERADFGTLAGYAALGLLCYFTHPLALVGSCVAIALVTFGEIALRLRTGRLAVRMSALWGPLRTMALAPALGFVPAALLAARFALVLRTQPPAFAAEGVSLPIWPRIQALISSALVASQSVAETLVSMAVLYLFVLLIGIVIARSIGIARLANGLFVCVIGFLLVYLFVPYQVFWRWMPERTLLYLFLVTLLWLGAQAPSAVRSRALLVRPVIVVAVLAVGVAGLVVRSTKYAELNRDLSEYMSAAEHVAPGSTIISLRLSPLMDGMPTLGRINIYLQAGARIALDRGAIDLKNVQASTPAFPITYRDGLSAFGIVATDREFNLFPPKVDLAAYFERTGIAIDYVLLWGSDEFLCPGPDDDDDKGIHLRRDSDECARIAARYRNLTTQLATSYELVFQSEERGLARLYRHKGDVGKAGS